MFTYFSRVFVSLFFLVKIVAVALPKVINGKRFIGGQEGHWLVVPYNARLGNYESCYSTGNNSKNDNSQENTSPRAIRQTTSAAFAGLHGLISRSVVFL